MYIDIEKYTTSLLTEYNLLHFEKTNILNDICFILFFGGNDFVEPFINSKIREKNNYTKLINNYVSILNKHNLYLILDNSQLNMDFFFEFLQFFSDNENSFVKKKSMSNYIQKVENENLTKYEKELQNYYHTFYTSEENPFYDYYKNINSLSINYKLPHVSWKKQYYSHFSSEDNVNDMCMEYFKSLIWTYKYYTEEGIPSWDFYYTYRVAPCPSDFIEFMKKNKNLKIKFEEADIISPIEQLLIVTPIQHVNILPWSFQFIYNKFEPIKFKLDVIKGGKNIYSEPILPKIDRHEIKTLLRNVPVSEIEKIRNTIKNKFFCMKF